MSKPEDSSYICWIDLETDGNAKQGGSIIEIGAVMTDRDFNELSSKHIVVHYPKRLIPLMNPMVQDMHTKNGLWDECEESEIDHRKADEMMEAWIRQFTKGNHIPLAGSGVSHFDHPRYIEVRLPKLDQYLSYWSYDVGTFRRMLQWFGLPVEDNRDTKTHRALEDIRDHIRETKAYRDQLRAYFSAYNAVSRSIYGSISQAMQKALGGDGQPI